MLREESRPSAPAWTHPPPGQEQHGASPERPVMILPGGQFFLAAGSREEWAHLDRPPVPVAFGGTCLLALFTGSPPPPRARL